MAVPIPRCDVLVHAGDFTRSGHPKEVLDFDKFLGSLDIKHKVVIAGKFHLQEPIRYYRFYSCSFFLTGNHERSFETESGMKDLLTNCIYLQDSLVELYGLKIYGTPWYLLRSYCQKVSTQLIRPFLKGTETPWRVQFKQRQPVVELLEQNTE
jgi:hypothetical protein